MDPKDSNGHAGGDEHRDDLGQSRDPGTAPVENDSAPATPNHDSRVSGSESSKTEGTPVVPVVVLIEDSVLEEDGVDDVVASPYTTNTKEGINPQEASAPVSPADTATLSTSQRSEITTEAAGADTNESLPSRTRKRRRPVRIAQVEEHEQRAPLSASRLPPNQYETVLRRRAIQKRAGDGTDSTVNSSAPPSPAVKKSPTLLSKKHAAELDIATAVVRRDSDDSVEQYDEDYGDISLGMKLTIVGGRVIVQAVKPLDDGRASPAQLSGLVQRGDVLLSVDHVSLVNFSLDQLVEGLKPLSSPQTGGSYKRTLHLRFAMGEGLKLLQKSEGPIKSSDAKDPELEAAGDIFSPLSQFLPMVDQLSGQPLFHEHTVHLATPVKANLTEARTAMSIPTTADRPKVVLDPYLEISEVVADQLHFDRQKYTSEFFVWNELQPELLRAKTLAQWFDDDEEIDYIPLTRSQMIERGEEAMRGARVVFYNVEGLDLGKGKTSLGRFSSTLSWSSSRRRYGSTANSLSESRAPSDAMSEGSNESGIHDEARDDELLLHFAARDEIWRKELMETLAKSANDILESDGDTEKNVSAKNSGNGNVDAAFSLGKMLLGAQVSKMLSTKRTHHALPEMEVTSVLYDLIARLLDTPEEINLLHGTQSEARTNLVPFHQTRRIVHDDDSLLAASFVVEQALPAWLKSFRPLPWDQRRLLWPRGHSSTNSGGSHFHSDDGLTTLESGSFGDMPHNSNPRKKSLEEKIEEKELDVESRNETCYLVTFYFTRELLPSLSGTSQNKTSNEKALVKFIERYGAYLKLHDCLVFADVVRARSVIDSLVSLARYDWTHKDALKEISRPGALVLYDRTLLSAILEKLKGIRIENNPSRRRDLIVLCASAYPDLRPWQVREACIPASRTSLADGDNEEFDSLYYKYLSLLLHPAEGNHAARKDCNLVQEWCELSIKAALAVTGGDSITDRKHNFTLVASSHSGGLYSRDLPALLKLSIQGNERGLALELVEAILSDSALLSNEQLFVDVRDSLRVIATDALGVDEDRSKSQDMDEQRLNVVFHLYEKIASSKSPSCRQSIVVSAELRSLLHLCSKVDNQKERFFIGLIARQAAPRDALRTLALWAEHFATTGESISALHTLTRRGAQTGIRTELSGSLLRVNSARQRRAALASAVAGDEATPSTGNIWGRMFEGSVSVDK